MARANQPASDLEAVAWYPNVGFGTQDVATKQENGFGLYDMLGNVYEWVLDDYEPYLLTHQQLSPVTDPISYNSIVGNVRTWRRDGAVWAGRPGVVRGCAFGSLSGYCRAANRGSADRGYRGDIVGFRPARSRRP